MEVEAFTQSAFKGQKECLKIMLMVILARGGLDCISLIELCFLRFNHFVKCFGSWLIIVPNAADLRNRPKNRSFELINVVRKVIWALNKLVFWFVDDLQLDLTDNFVVEPDIDQDIICSFTESIFYPDDLHLFGVCLADVHDVFQNADGLLFLWGTFASNQVSNFECDEVWRCWPILPLSSDFLIEKTLWNS